MTTIHCLRSSRRGPKLPERPRLSSHSDGTMQTTYLLPLDPSLERSERKRRKQEKLNKPLPPTPLANTNSHLLVNASDTSSRKWTCLPSKDASDYSVAVLPRRVSRPFAHAPHINCTELGAFCYRRSARYGELYASFRVTKLTLSQHLHRLVQQEFRTVIHQQYADCCSPRPALPVIRYHAIVHEFNLVPPSNAVLSLLRSRSYQKRLDEVWKPVFQSPYIH